MKQYHLIDQKGNKVEMGADEFYQHKQLNESKETKDVLQFDINSVPLEIRKRQYKDYRPIFDFVNRECRDWNLDENLNYKGSEIGEIQKINIESSIQVIKKLKDFYHLDAFQYEAYSPHRVKLIEVRKIPVYYQATNIITIPKIKENVDIIIEEMKNSGYYKVRERKTKDNEGMEWITLVFDPVRKDSITTQVRNHCRYLYHYSPESTHNDIIQNGLIAQNQGRVYIYNEPRVYLYTGNPNDEEYKRMMCNVSQNRRRKLKVDEQYYLYEIKTSNIPESVNFFEAPHGDNCVFTPNDIPIDAINDSEIASFI